VFVLTHHERDPVQMSGGTTFEFVTDGIASASALWGLPDREALASAFDATARLLAKYGVRSSGRDIVIDDSSALESFAKPNALIDG